MIQEWCEITDLKGKTLSKILMEPSREIVVFITKNNEYFLMYHIQECCEHVQLEEVIGDLRDLIGASIVEAKETSNADPPEDSPNTYDSETWTFYDLGTMNGCVTFRWLGESNGFYSEEVDIQSCNLEYLINFLSYALVSYSEIDYNSVKEDDYKIIYTENRVCGSGSVDPNYSDFGDNFMHLRDKVRKIIYKIIENKIVTGNGVIEMDIMKELAKRGLLKK